MEGTCDPSQPLKSLISKRVQFNFPEDKAAECACHAVVVNLNSGDFFLLIRKLLWNSPPDPSRLPLPQPSSLQNKAAIKINSKS